MVHRDLKPANILVDADGRVRLLDFGIAKLFNQDAAVLTRTASVLLTPAYSAPEQISGGPITTAADVYALRLLLFELLAGCRPWPDAGSSLAQTSPRTDDPGWFAVCLVRVHRTEAEELFHPIAGVAASVSVEAAL